MLSRKTSVRRAIRLAALGAILAACGGSGPHVDAPQATEASAQETRRVRFHLVAPESGHEHEIDVFVPSGTPPREGYPVVLALDGNRVSALLEEALEAGARLDAAVVALGYRGTRDFAVRERAFDFTPTTREGLRAPDPLSSERENGGAEAFVRFIEEVVKPEVARRAPIDWRRSTLFGHSYGGLFVLYAMLERPRAFARYVAVDPSLWWRDAQLFERLMREAPPEGVELELVQANPDLPHETAGRTPERVELRRRLHAALPADAYAQLTARYGARYRYEAAHHHGSLFVASLRALFGFDSPVEAR